MNLEQFHAELKKQKTFLNTPIETYFENKPEALAPIMVPGEPDGVNSVLLTPEEWYKEKEFWRQHPPTEGDYLRTESGKKARLEIHTEQGQRPFIFGRVFLPIVIGSVLSWYLRDENDESQWGAKCILLPKSIEQVEKRGLLTGKILLVKELRVCRPSQSGNSFLCEVAEW